MFNNYFSFCIHVVFSIFYEKNIPGRFMSKILFDCQCKVFLQTYVLVLYKKSLKKTSCIVQICKDYSSLQTT